MKTNLSRNDKVEALRLGYSAHTVAPARTPTFVSKDHAADNFEYRFYITRHASGYNASYVLYNQGRTAVYDNGNETVIAEDCPSLSMADELIDSFIEHA